MAFMTPQEIRAIRMRGSQVVKLDGLDKEVRIIKMSSAASLKSAELQADVAHGRRKQTDVIFFMLEHALADLDGTPLTAEDANVIASLLPMAGLTKLVNAISATIGDGSSVKVEDQPQLSPAEKKD